MPGVRGGVARRPPDRRLPDRTVDEPRIRGTDADHGTSDPEIDRAHDRALGFLSFRPRSQREVAIYLRRKGYAETSVDAVLDRLTRAGLVNDAHFASYWVSNRTQFSPRGRRALQQELRQKGVGRDVIARALEEAVPDLAQAVAAGRKKAASLFSLGPDEFRRRMIGFLARRGFTYGDSTEATSMLWSEAEQSNYG